MHLIAWKWAVSLAPPRQGFTFFRSKINQVQGRTFQAIRVFSLSKVKACWGERGGGRQKTKSRFKVTAKGRMTPCHLGQSTLTNWTSGLITGRQD